MVPPEVTMRTYLHLFGALAPLEFQKGARGATARASSTRGTTTSPRSGSPTIASTSPARRRPTRSWWPPSSASASRSATARSSTTGKEDAAEPVQERVIFAFDPPKGHVSTAQTSLRGSTCLHRTFLGYPARSRRRERSQRFYALYETIAKEHAKAAPKSRFTPDEAGWAAVCYGLVRHPEFHLY